MLFIFWLIELVMPLTYERSLLSKVSALEILRKDKQTNILPNKNLKKIKAAQRDALIKVFKQKNIPFREFKINKICEEVLGQLFSYFILETIIIGKLVNINPYNQPAVELIKKDTKKILI